jgi:hypothetical protein
MGPATIRRLAFVAAILLLSPVWCRPAEVAEALESPRRALVGLAPAGAGAVPAVRRHAAGAWWTAASRPDHGRHLAIVGLLALFSLTGMVRWGTLPTVTSARPPLGRRRYVISLRAPPPTCCA